jgi:hypothetical protein
MSEFLDSLDLKKLMRAGVLIVTLATVLAFT